MKPNYSTSISSDDHFTLTLYTEDDNQKMNKEAYKISFDDLFKILKEEKKKQLQIDREIIDRLELDHQDFYKAFNGADRTGRLRRALRRVEKRTESRK